MALTFHKIKHINTCIEEISLIIIVNEINKYTHTHIYIYIEREGMYTHTHTCTLDINL